MKTHPRTPPEKASTPVAGKGKNGGRSSLAALMARLTSLNRKYQDVGIESTARRADSIEPAKKPANPASKPATVLDKDQLERTDFFACLLRNWTPKD